MKPQGEVQSKWYAVRTIHMPDDDERGIDSIRIWMERREGGEWAVGRASDLAQREYPEPRDTDYVFSGFDLDDALQAANNALEDDVVASEMDGMTEEQVRPFTHKELEDPLNEWFWGRRSN